MDSLPTFATCILTLSVLSFVSHKLYTWHFKKMLRSCVNIPKMQIRIWTWIQNIWLKKQSSPLQGVFQILCGAAHVFQKEGIFLIMIFAKPHVCIFKAELIKAVINHPAAGSKSYLYKTLEPLLGTGLVTSNGEKWTKHRKLLTPAFHMELLKNYTSVFHENAKILIKRLRNSMHDDPCIEIDSFVNFCVLDIINECAMGCKMNLQEGGSEAKEYYNALEEVLQAVMYRIGRPWTWNEFLFSMFPMAKKQKKAIDTVHALPKRVMKEKEEEVLSKQTQEQRPSLKKDIYNSKRKRLIECLLENLLKNSDFTMEDVKEEVNTFIPAGSDTTSKAIKFAILLLGLYPEIQLKASREVEFVLGNKNNEEITVDDLKELKYIECIIKETLRLYPSIPVIGREVQDTIKTGNYTIPKGSCMIIFIHMLHRDPEVFPNPEKFDPDRFTSDNMEQMKPYAFIPFSAGTRNCIGQKFAMLELKSILSHLLLNFEWKSLIHRDELSLSWLIVSDTEPVKIRLTARHPENYRHRN